MQDVKRMRSVINDLVNTNKSLCEMSKEYGMDCATLGGIRKALEHIDIINEFDLSNIKNKQYRKVKFNGRKRLSEDTVNLICELLEYGYISNMDIQGITDISKDVISGIRNGVSYKDISKNYAIQKCTYTGCPGSIKKGDYPKRKKILEKAKKKFDKLKKHKIFYTDEYYEYLKNQNG